MVYNQNMVKFFMNYLNNSKKFKTKHIIKIVDVIIMIIIFSSLIYMIFKKELKLFIFEYLNMNLQQNKP
jgi:hypothetical protein